MLPWKSLSFRLALTYAGLFCVSAALLFGGYYGLSVRLPKAEVRRDVERDAARLAHLYIVDGPTALDAALRRRAATPGGRKPFHAFLDPDGRIVTANLPSWPKSTTGWTMIEADLYREGDESDHKAIVHDRLFHDGARLLVGLDAEDVYERQEALATAAAWMIGGTLLLSLIGGLLMSRAIRRRLDLVDLAARRVMQGDLSGRVPLNGSGDDFDRLGQSLNHMLAGVEGSFEAVRRASDSVAHELRTPLSRLLAYLDQLEEAETETEPERRAAIRAAAVGEVQRLHRIIDAVLRVGRLQNGRHAVGAHPVDVSDLCAAVAEFYVPEAERRRIDLSGRIEPGLQVPGDADLLFQALANLLDNALKFTPEGGRVELEARAADGGVFLSVTDDGPGLAPGEERRITERFYRGAASAGTDGEGLGLSLVAAIAERHQADLDFVRENPGLRVRLTFPGPAAAP